MISTNTANYKEKFIEYASLIKREGIEDLMAWINNVKKSDFYSAPASTKYHSNIEGGLCMHTVKVFERMLKKMPELKSVYPTLTEEEVVEKIAVVALFHDLCKTNFYTLATRRAKNEETGVWETVPYYKVDDKLPLGHAEKSLYIVQRYIMVDVDEAAAILAHMGDFEDNKTGQIYQKYPLAIHLHIADLEATYLDEQVYPA